VLVGDASPAHIPHLSAIHVGETIGRRRSPQQGRFSVKRSHSGFVALVFGLVGLSCGAPKGAIAESSKTDECRADIVGALGAFKRDLGLDFDVTDADADAMFSEAQVGKSYGRDGARHEVSFGLDVTNDGGCSMRFFEKRTREPGSSSMTRGNYGSVDLNVCRCE
jgi:hypothetical protein